jgi:beta-N-acetylhexosaminidase
VPIDAEVRRLALSCLLLGFVGPIPPGWLLHALGDGLGGVVLFGSNVRGRDVRELTDTLRAAAGHDIVLALDEEGGDVTRLDDVSGSVSPGAAALGQLDDPGTTEELAAALASRLVSNGLTLNLAPVADVNVEPLNPVIGVRSFGSDPAVVARHVAAAVRGTQRTGIAAAVKHFPGHGATVADSHHEVPVLPRTREQLRTVEYEPFRAAIAAGTRAVMTGHLLVPALDQDSIATISAQVTTGVLRGELGFEGAVVTDALEMRAVSGTIGIVAAFVQALVAGADCIETGALDYPDLVEQVPRAVAAALENGTLTPERLREAAERTGGLARRGDPSAGFDPEVVSAAPARCVEVRGELPALHAPLVVECRPPGGMASGELPWSLAGPLADLLAGTQALAVTDASGAAGIAERAAGRSLVVVVRDPARHEWQRAAIGAAVAHREAVVVDVGWPAPLADPVPLVRTRGVAPGLLAAAASMLARRSR